MDMLNRDSSSSSLEEDKKEEEEAKLAIPPNNIKLVIFSFLSTNELLCRYSKVSKGMRQLLADCKNS
jgi:hypothetical protein